MSAENEHVFVGGDGSQLSHKVEERVTVVFDKMIDPLFRVMQKAVQKHLLINNGLLLFFDDEGRVATICGIDDTTDGPPKNENIDRAIKALQGAILMLETQKLKS